MGVGLRNLWVRPDVRVVADEAADQANLLRRATLKIDGLLCALWVLNVRRALAGHPGIRDVTITGESDTVDVVYVAAETSAAVLCRQVMATVVLPGVRNFLGGFSSPPS
jgi:copper chaperone CopZ